MENTPIQNSETIFPPKALVGSVGAMSKELSNGSEACEEFFFALFWYPIKKVSEIKPEKSLYYISHRKPSRLNKKRSLHTRRDLFISRFYE